MTSQQPDWGVPVARKQPLPGSHSPPLTAPGDLWQGLSWPGLCWPHLASHPLSSQDGLLTRHPAPCQRSRPPKAGRKGKTCPLPHTGAGQLSLQSPKLGPTQMPTNRCLARQLLAYTFSEMLVSNKEEGVADLCNNLDKSQDNYAEHEKPGQKTVHSV